MEVSGTFPGFVREGGPLILRPRFGQFLEFSASPSFLAVTGSVSLPPKMYRKLWIYFETTSGNFSISAYASFDSGYMIMRLSAELGISHVF